MVTTQEPRVALATDPTIGFRRVSAAIALPLAFVFQLVCNTIFAFIQTESGVLDAETATVSLELESRYPGQFIAKAVFAVAGAMVAIPGLLGALRVLRPAVPVLALITVVMMVSGYLLYGAMVFGTFAEVNLAAAGIDAGEALDTGPGVPWRIAAGIVFVLGNLVGTLLLAIAVLIASRRMRGVGVPWWAGLLIAGWPVGHLINIFGGGEWFAVGGGVLEIIGLSFLARAMLRMPNADWVLRG
ncbi:hypothetical protein [Gulosibacter molinativorax]|uniref:DUF4386 domain-containing protein n=1 Tax=Gulosibacter molinativorax TaxID=256821 RepID=A0ABT7C9N6_9MICO|nr:hypothetical protein [Gulosibacter molinativorax]MDJ1371457.1 hypothetical protein [Gulosibacter molinativorax]QUY62955.1 Hypotetical protein [Gulosibacter molinativorax]